MLAILLTAAAALAAWLWWRGGATVEETAAAVEWIRERTASPFVFAAAATALCTVKPTVLVPLGGAVLFGFWPGLVLTLASVNAGAWLGYLVGRGLRLRHGGGPIGARLERTLDWVGRRGIWTFASTRLAGFPPAALVQLGSGMSRSAFRDFALGTFLGMLPWALVVTFFADRIWKRAVESGDFSLSEVGPYLWASIGTLIALSTLVAVCRAVHRR